LPLNCLTLRPQEAISIYELNLSGSPTWSQMITRGAVAPTTPTQPSPAKQYTWSNGFVARWFAKQNFALPFVVEASGGGNIPSQIAGTGFNIQVTAQDDSITPGSILFTPHNNEQTPDWATHRHSAHSLAKLVNRKLSVVSQNRYTVRPFYRRTPIDSASSSNTFIAKRNLDGSRDSLELTVEQNKYLENMKLEPRTHTSTIQIPLHILCINAVSQERISEEMNLYRYYWKVP